MKRMTIWMVAVLALMGGLTLRVEAQQKTIKCAVHTGTTVTIEEATKERRFVDYRGRRYFFCAPECMKTFRDDPEKYAKNPSIPIPKAPGGSSGRPL